MSNNLISLYNLALSSVGHRDFVSDPGEVSRGNEICTLWYEPTRDLVLKAAPWSAAKATARLGVLRELASDTWVAADPEPGWRFAYALPNDFLYPRFLFTYQRFELGVYGNERALFANDENVMLLYTSRASNIGLWDHGLYMAVAYALAANIAMPLTGKPARAKLAQEMANDSILKARAASANEGAETFDSIPDWLSARGVNSPSIVNTYIYPTGPLLAVANVQ